MCLLGYRECSQLASSSSLVYVSYDMEPIHMMQNFAVLCSRSNYYEFVDLNGLETYPNEFFK